MVALAKAHGLRTEVTSNALLLTAELARRLIDVGLDQFVVSVDGASAESFGDVRSGASLAQVVRNVKQLNDYAGPYYSPSVRIGLQFVAMRRNVQELPALERLAADLAASFIVVSNVLPYTEELVSEALYHDAATARTGDGLARMPRWYLPRLEWNDHTAGPLSHVLRRATYVSYLDADLSGWGNHCPFVQAGALAVSWDGGVSPCPPLLHSYRCFVKDREKAFRRCVMGSLQERSLAETWSDPQYVDLRRRVLAFDFPPCVDCGGCEAAERNEEDCFGNPFPVCGDCLWARGVIRCA
jgi:MoaA/NifB/PqqE/SkfB family radical SAM enzyme